MVFIFQQKRIHHLFFPFKLKKIILFFVLFPFFSFSQIRISADSIIEFGKKQLGIKYSYGNCTPKKGFDCSGFVYYVFTHFNINVPRASMDYEKLGKIISPDSAKPGDIIVFTGTNAKNRAPGHVGIILSKPGEIIKFIHSSSSKKKSGIKISSYEESPDYKKRFIKMVRPENLSD